MTERPIQLVLLDAEGKLDTMTLSDLVEQLKSPPVDLTELLGSLDSMARKDETQGKELQALRVRVRALEGKNPTAPVVKVFKVKSDFDASKWPAELSRRYTEVRTWLASFAQRHINRMIAADVAHMKDFRYGQTYINTLLVLMRLGDPWAAKELARVWKGLRSSTTDRYGAEASHNKLEQVGVLRWLYTTKEGGVNDDAGFAHTDRHSLESDLMSGTIAESLRGLWDNLDIPECKTEHDALLTFYREQWLVRREFLAKNVMSKIPSFMNGSGLVHPTISRYCEHGHMYAMHGLPQDKEAMDTFGGWLAADHDYVQAPDGQPVVVFPQGCQGRYDAFRGEGKNAGVHRMVYTPESFPAYEIASWCGLPLATETLLNALPRTLYWTLPSFKGVDDGTWAIDIGGGPVKGSSRRVVQFRDGSTVPGRWQLAEPKEGGHGSHSLARGLSHLSAYRVTNTLTGLEAEMQGLLKRYKSNGHSAITVPLLLIEARRAGVF